MFDILATIVGPVADQADAERLAQDIHAVVVRARTLGCVVEIHDLRLGRELQRLLVLPHTLGE